MNVIAQETVSASGGGLRVGPIQLVPGITHGHLVTAIIASIATNCLMSFVNVVQPMVLTDNLAVPVSSQGTVSGNLTFISELVALCLLGPLGALSDRIGRRPVVAFGFLAMGAGYVLYPLMPSVPTLYASRAVFAVGVAAVAGMMATILNDYPAESSRGRMMALGGVANGVGGLIMVLGLAQLPAVLQQMGFPADRVLLITFGITAIACAIISVVLWLGLHPGKGAEVTHESLITRMIHGLRAGARPRVAVAYAAAFVARSDFVVVGTFFMLWAVQAGQQAGLTSAEATGRAGILFAVMQGTALLSAPLVGMLIDRIDRLYALALCMLIVCVGYTGVGMLETPMSPATYFLSALVGAGMMSGFLASQALIGESAEEDRRGAIIGVFGFSGAVGILFVTSLGGFLYDRWSPSGPFFLIGVMSFVLILVSFAIRRLEQHRGIDSHG